MSDYSTTTVGRHINEHGQFGVCITVNGGSVGIDTAAARLLAAQILTWATNSETANNERKAKPAAVAIGPDAWRGVFDGPSELAEKPKRRRKARVVRARRRAGLVGAVVEDIMEKRRVRRRAAYAAKKKAGRVGKATKADKAFEIQPA